MATQKEHIDEVALTLGVPQTVVAAVIRKHQELLVRSLQAGETVRFRGFGTFRGKTFIPGAALNGTSIPEPVVTQAASQARSAAKVAAAPAKKAPTKKAAKKAPAKPKKAVRKSRSKA